MLKDLRCPGSEQNRGTYAAYLIVLAVLTAPLIIVATALLPALLVCPFLSVRYQQHGLQLLAMLRAWALAQGDVVSVGGENLDEKCAS